jgi:predicted nucleotidyltransferase
MKTTLERNIRLPMDEIRAFCERNHIQRLALFGSVLRDDFREAGDDPSDIDVLVTFEPGYTPGWDYYVWGNDLSAVFGRTTEVFTAAELSPAFRQKVLSERLVIYERE